MREFNVTTFIGSTLIRKLEKKLVWYSFIAYTKEIRKLSVKVASKSVKRFLSFSEAKNGLYFSVLLFRCRFFLLANKRILRYKINFECCFVSQTNRYDSDAI